jgi:hypothetical protein
MIAIIIIALLIAILSIGYKYMYTRTISVSVIAARGIDMFSIGGVPGSRPTVRLFFASLSAPSNWTSSTLKADVST